MSAKWRALQHRHRYTYSAIIFPQYYTEAINQLTIDSSCSKYYTELNELISLNSTYAQISHVKKLASAFGDLLANGDDNSVSVAARFYLEILFLENSLPLHKTLVSVLAKNRNFQTVIGGCFRSLCEEYGGVKGKGRRFCVSRAALSMMGSPKLGYIVEIVEECAVLVALDIVYGLNSVVLETNDWSQPSPIVMEQCQEALSCMYYLLQRFPLKFIDLNDEEKVLKLGDSNVLEMIVTTILGILKSVAFSRDCFVAAGVSFWVALQACLTPEELGLVIMEGIFRHTSVIVLRSECLNPIMKVPCKQTLFSEIQNLSVLSRLCLIRGILTSVSRTVLNTPFAVSDDYSSNGICTQGDTRTILYDGILPELCIYCENPTDSHFNFHALTVLQICLQQIKTSIQTNIDGPTENNPISEKMCTRLLRIIWDNLEDPLSQTVKQVHLIFDLFLDIQASLNWAEGSERIKIFLKKIACDLLRMGSRCKGRYIPLALLTKRLGAKTILDMNPELLFETTHAYMDDDVCCAATSFLKCFLERLLDECWRSDGVEGGYTVYRGHCLRPFLYGLASGVSKLRSNLNTYALPILLEVDVDCIFPMLAFVSLGQETENADVAFPELNGTNIVLRVEQQVAVLVSLLKVSRSLALIEGDIDWFEDSSKEKSGSYALVTVKGMPVRVLVKWLILALTHVDDSLRVDAAETLFLNPKTASLPSSLELSLMKEAIPLNMRSCSTAFQMKLTSLFRKFFSRVRTALERQLKLSWQPHASQEYNGTGPVKGTDINRAEDLYRFMKWLSCFLFFSCYPSAPYERKVLAMELILIMNNSWPIVPINENNLNPYSKGFTLPDSTLLLVGSIINSWDRLRESSFKILVHFPTPLPGISSPESVIGIIIWAKKLVFSPRVRESDAGALTLRLIFRKYVLDLGWFVSVSSNTVNRDDLSRPSRSAAIEYVSSLIEWLRTAVEEGEKDLSEACKKSFVHGVLLSLRYTFDEMDWNSDVVFRNVYEIKCELEKLLELVMRITSLALWVVSADAWHLPEDMDGISDDDDDDDVTLEVPVEPGSCEDEAKCSKIVKDIRPSEQIVMVGCWLAMKEMSLLLGTIIRKIPLPTSTISATSDVPITPSESDVMLDLKQLETIGDHFLEVLLKMKHNGAIDKTRAGFTALCNRLLCSNDPRLGKLTESWMDQLMERTVAKGQTVDDLLRRSAGIPAAFIAFFLSEPEGTPKRLLPRALRWLIDVANKSLSDHQTDARSSERIFSDDERISKIRDEGVIPTVHAFNVLKAAFNDANLSTDTSGFSAEALIISIRSFSSSYWEIRNSAVLAYTAILRRTIGFLNVQKRESARRALTGLEFFHRYPSLHPFLLNELKVATELLKDGSSEHLASNLASSVHPSLCPILIFLSRLKPSTITTETLDCLDPFLFMPFIIKCSTQNNLRIRVLASRALSGLISNDKLPLVLVNIASQLPTLQNHASFNSIHGTLLQLISLLDINCRNLSDSSKKDQILDGLIPILVDHSWICKPSLCPCPTLNGSFLSVLDNMLSIARTCQVSKSIGDISKLLCDLSLECLDAESFRGSDYYDPTISELRKQAAFSYFNCVFQANKDIVVEEDFPMPRVYFPSALNTVKSSEIGDFLSGFQERLLLSISDESYEVRISTFKWLNLFLKATESGIEDGDESCVGISVSGWINANLQNMLMNLLDSENNHRCTYYILKILFTWNLLKFKKPTKCTTETTFIGNMKTDSVLQFWEKLVSLYKVCRHAKTREVLLCCMGICVKRLADLLTFLILHSNEVEQQAHLYDCVSYYVSLIERHGDSSQPVNIRKAAAESMVASGLLKQAEVIGSSVVSNRIPSENLSPSFEQNEAAELYARKILNLWSTCVKLLEDEDDGLRRNLATNVQKCFSSNESRRNLGTGVVPSQVDNVIISSFEHLSWIFGHWIEFFDYLARWVLDSANKVVSRGDLVRRVFDKEIDNHHEEKLLICQICCSHIEKGVDFFDQHAVLSFLEKWRMRFREQLVLFADEQYGKRGRVEWIGGMGNHKDAFLPLYANLLGFYAISKCIFGIESEKREFVLLEIGELGEIIKPFLRNPFISDLYLLVIKLHDSTSADKSESPWDVFDPYFLLK